MPLFTVAIIEPELKATYQGDKSRDEQIILPPTALLAPNIEGAKVAAIAQAVSEAPKREGTTDSRRWEVYATPFE